MLPTSLLDECATLLDRPVIASTPVGGGDISMAFRLDTAEDHFFLKYHGAPQAEVMFQTEALGLKALATTQAIRIPQVIGTMRGKEYAFLLLEFIAPNAAKGISWQNFGTQLADLHKNQATAFGWDQDNFIGSLPQENPWTTDWIDFYRQFRLEAQIERARDHHLLNQTDIKQFSILYARLANLMPEVKPALLHGDLWNGNFLSDQYGLPVLIDPAVYYGHREVDLAMTRLFGGFPEAFYAAYQDRFPLDPGWKERVPLYQLYYLLVHVNLFGGSYVNSVKNVVKRFL